MYNEGIRLCICIHLYVNVKGSVCMLSSSFFCIYGFNLILIMWCGIVSTGNDAIISDVFSFSRSDYIHLLLPGDCLLPYVAAILDGTVSDVLRPMYLCVPHFTNHRTSHWHLFQNSGQSCYCSLM